jgi:hypothetical protein
VDKTSKSPKSVLLAAYRVGQARLRAYSHRFSPKKFTQPQLFACLVLKEFLQLDYRKLAAVLADSPDWTAAIGLGQVPHFTTFQKAAQRLLVSRRARRLLDETVERAVKAKRIKRRVKLAAIDGTGLESRHVSLYYVKRCEKTAKNQRTAYRRFPKAGIVGDCASHLILAIVPGRGPGPDDKHYQPALAQAASCVSIETLLADAGYDSEAAHEHARQTHGMRTIIPPTRGRPTDKLPTGRWRKRMATHFNRRKYGQRWQIETINSMFKRLLGAALRARKYWTQHREIILRAITHNLMILRNKVFYRAVERLFGAERVTDGANPPFVDLRQRLQHINRPHRVVQHFVHAERVWMPLAEIGNRFVVGLGVLPQEAARAKDNKASLT